jgi:hypothetical protein
MGASTTVMSVASLIFGLTALVWSLVGPRRPGTALPCALVIQLTAAAGVCGYGVGRDDELASLIACAAALIGAAAFVVHTLRGGPGDDEGGRGPRPRGPRLDWDAFERGFRAHAGASERRRAARR